MNKSSQGPLRSAVGETWGKNGTLLGEEVNVSLIHFDFPSPKLYEESISTIALSEVPAPCLCTVFSTQVSPAEWALDSVLDTASTSPSAERVFSA